MLKKFLIFFGIIIVLFILMNNIIMPLYVKHSDTVITPKVTGTNYLEAKKVIEEAGLEIIQGDIKYDESIPIGLIIDQNPPPNADVKYGRRIYVTISGGEQLSEVPNLIGKSLRDAKFTLEQRGLQLGETVRKSSGDFPEDVVISQIIQPGSKVKRDSKLDLILSDGPSIGDLKVPNVVGKTLDDAKKLITESKLKIGKITYQTNNNVPPGQIVDQYPKSDKSANENTSVDIFVARKKVIEDFEVIQEDNSADNSDEKDSEKNTEDKGSTKDKPLIKKDNSTEKEKTSTNTDKKEDTKKDIPDKEPDENSGDEIPK